MASARISPPDRGVMKALHNQAARVYAMITVLPEELEGTDLGPLTKWPASEAESRELVAETSHKVGAILAYALCHNAPHLVIELITVHQPSELAKILQNYKMKEGYDELFDPTKAVTRSAFLLDHNWRFVATLLEKVDQLGHLRGVLGHSAIKYFES